jgi:signal transduction histidine kinase
MVPAMRPNAARPRAIWTISAPGSGANSHSRNSTATGITRYKAAGVDTYNYWPTIIAGLVVAYTAAAHLRPRLAVLALACLYTAIAVSSLRGPSGLLWGGIVITGAALAGFGLRDRRQHVRQLAGLAHQLELARDENARTAVAGERARIARELHDVVAHSVSVMVVQAGAAEEVLAAAPARARESLRSVQDTGRRWSNCAGCSESCAPMTARRRSRRSLGSTR